MRSEAEEFSLAIQKHFSLSQNERDGLGDAAREKARTFAYEPYIDNVLAAAIYARDEAQQRRNVIF